MAEFTFFGHSTVQFRTDTGKVVLIDPWVMQNPSCPDEIRRNLQSVDAMLITHAHNDHIGDAVELARRYEPSIVVANFETCQWLARKGVKNTSPMNIGGSQDVLGLRVTMTRADHSCGITDGDEILYGGAAGGYTVQMPGGFTFYHAGDTGLFSDMKLLAELYQPQLVFLPIGGLYTMDPHQAARACGFLQAKQIIPIHWGTFPSLTGKPIQLETELSKLGITTEMIAMEPGETYRR